MSGTEFLKYLIFFTDFQIPVFSAKQIISHFTAPDSPDDNFYTATDVHG